MQTINRFLYGPTAEEKVRAWQGKLRSEQRTIEREMRQVRHPLSLPPLAPHPLPARYRDEEGAGDGEAARQEGRCEVCAHHGQGGRTEPQTDGPAFCEQSQTRLHRKPATAATGYVSTVRPDGSRTESACYCRKAMAKVTGSLQKSTEIMKLSNSLIKLPQISQTMREMSMEMTKVSSTPWVLDGY